MHEMYDEFWLIGETLDFDFIKEIGNKVHKSDGATCKFCGEFYPYAEPEPDTEFKCWSCRNF